MSGQGENLPEPAGSSEVDRDTVDLLAASLRSDQSDLSSYTRVLTSTLQGALPEELLEIDRARSMRDRFSRGEGQVVAIRAHFGDDTLELVEERRGLVGYATKNVRGVSISRKQVTFEEWTRLFAEALSRFARESSAARAALGRLLGAE